MYNVKGTNSLFRNCVVIFGIKNGKQGIFVFKITAFSTNTTQTDHPFTRGSNAHIVGIGKSFVFVRHSITSCWPCAIACNEQTSIVKEEHHLSRHRMHFSHNLHTELKCKLIKYNYVVITVHY